MAKNRKIEPITVNRRARHDYEIVDTLEAGVALLGSEVKSLRGGKAHLTDGYVRIEKGEAWLMDAHISPYDQANRENHEPRRQRKLLLSNNEILRWGRKTTEKGFTVVPLKMYFKGPWAKVEIGLVRGRKQHDKRENLKEKQDRREMARALKET